MNVLIALFDADHISHHAAVGWFSADAVNGWASCPITQNGCVRIVLDDRLIDTTRVHGPRQLTDACLLALAVSRGGVLVTFDRSSAVNAVRGTTAASLVVL